MSIRSRPPSGVQEKSHKVRKSPSQVHFSSMRLTLSAARETSHRASNFASRLVDARYARCSETSTCSVGHLRDATDPGYGRGIPFWALNYSGLGSLARVTPLILCDLTFSLCLILTKSIRDAKVV